MTKYQVEINRTYVYNVEADSKEAAVNKVDNNNNLTPSYDEFQYATATEVAEPVYEFSTTDGELVATYPVTLPDSEEEGSIQFHLTPEGLIVDVFDHNGECVSTFAKTAQEFSDYLLEAP
jgi:hypothetical protein